MKKIILIIFIALFAQIDAQNCMQIGTNLGGIDSQVFKDLKKTSTHFFTQNVVYLASNPNYWDTQLIDSIPRDLNGYPTIDIPFSHSSVDTTQVYHFMVGSDSIYPIGHYIMNFDGIGVVDVSHWSDASNITYPTANRIEFDILVTSTSGIHIEVMESDASDYIRNISIVHEDDLSSFETQPFRTELIDLSQDFQCLRFMDWMGTNHPNLDTFINYDTTPLTWNDRILAGTHRVHDEHGGMSYEHLIDFSNEVNKDVWVNIPHLADSNYIFQMATLLKNNLNNDLAIYVEFSNEVWNTIFQQTDYVREEGPYLNDLPRNYAWYSTNAFNIFETVFGVERNRLKFVLAGLDWSLLDAVPEAISLGADIDFVSYPGYFNLGETGWASMEALGSSATADDIITAAQNNMAEEFYWMKMFKELVCDPNDIDFIMYEGGQHLLRLFGYQETFQQAIYDAQLDDGMYDLYQDLLLFCRDTLEVKLFNHYLLYGPNQSNYGSWGMVESIYETPNTPKYNALMSFKCENDTIIIPTDTTGIDIMSHDVFKINLFPNPVSNLLNISIEQSFRGTLTIYNTKGQIVFSKKIKEKQNLIEVSSLNKGIYILELNSNLERSFSQFYKM